MTTVDATLPLVSIGIPTYNRATLLVRAVESALRQDYAALEVVISDNASVDGTETICRALAANDSRIRYFRRDRNEGPAINFNAVLENARGEYFMWLSDDDWLDPNYLSECARVLRGRIDVAMVAGRCRLYDSSSSFLRVDKPTTLVARWRVWRLLRYYAGVTTNSIFYGLMRTADVRPAGIGSALANDWNVVARQALAGRVLTLETTFVHRVLGGTSQSMSKIVETLGLSPRQAWFPRLTIAINCAGFVANAPWPQPAGFVTRKSSALLTFGVLAIRSMVIWAARIIPTKLRKKWAYRLRLE